MQGQVANLIFLDDHKDENPWSEKTKSDFELLKKLLI